MKFLIGFLPYVGTYLFFLSFSYSVNAQSIVPATDDTNTVVTPSGDRLDITGGALSEDGANLFHGFQEFGLSADQIANFLVDPAIQNILGRVSGGNASLIDGLLQVSGGDANLFLINPAGIVLGPNSALNLSGGFTATTADGIGFGQNWFTAVGSNDYTALVGNPDTFAFVTGEPGAIFNGGQLAVNAGETLRLLGGALINTGTLSAPGGTITVAAVEGEQWVRISEENGALSLDLPLATPAEGVSTDALLTPLDLPALLTGSGLGAALGVVVDADGGVTLTGSDVGLPTAAGSAIASGAINTSCIAPVCDLATPTGGEIALLGNTVGVLAGTLTASGTEGGGEILIGGDYLGQGTVPNATVTVVDEHSAIVANALTMGDGGRVIVWSDQTSRIAGEIQARGGATAGNGGFVETSSAGFLEIQGAPDVSAPAGIAGSWLIDPSDIEIGDFGGVSTGISATAPFEVTAGTAQLDVADLLMALASGTDVTVSTEGTPGSFQNGDITLSTALDFNGIGDGKTLTLQADQQIEIAAPIFDSDTTSATLDSLNLTLDGRRGVVITPGAAINTQGGDVSITADNGIDVAAGIAINSDINSFGGDITLQADDSNTDGIVVNAAIASGGGDIELDGRGNDVGVRIDGEIDAGSGALRLTSENFGTAQVGVLLGPTGELIVEADPTHSRDIEITAQVSFAETGIEINRAIDTQGRNLVLNGFRGVQISSEAAIDTQGGALTIESSSVSGAGIQINGAIDSAGGDVDIDGRGADVGLAVNAAITVDDGALDLRGRAGGNGVAGVVIGPGGELIVNADPAHSRDINIVSDDSSETGINLQRAIDTRGRNLTIEGNQGVLINPGAFIGTQGGNLTIEAASSAGAGVVINEEVNSAGGDVDIFGNGSDVGLTVNAAIDAGSGALQLETGNFGNGSASILLTPTGELIVEADPTHSSTIELISTGSTSTSSGIQLQNSIDTQGRNLIINGRRGVQINSGADINSQGGDISIEANVFNGDGIVVDGNIDSAGGAIDIDGNGSGPGLTVNAVIDAGSGDLRLNGEASGNGAGFVLNPTGELVVEDDPTHSSNIEILSDSFSGAGVALNRAIDTHGRNLEINAPQGVVLNPGAAIDTQGGGVNIETSGVASSDAIGITIDERINSAGGSVNIAGRGSGPGVTVNAAIDVGSGELSLTGDTGGNGAGLVITPNGDLVVEADPTHSSNIALFSDSFGGTGITLDRAIDTQGRNLTLTGSQGVQINPGATINSQGGDITIEADSTNSSAVGVVVNAAIDSAGGTIGIDGAGSGPGLTVNAVIDAGSGGLSLQGDTGGSEPGFVLNPAGELVVEADPTHSETIEIFSNTGAGPGIALNRSVDTQGRNLIIDSRPGVLITPGASVDSQGGDITFESDGVNSGGIVIDGTIDSSGGAINIDGTGDEGPGLIVNAAIDAGSGNLRLNGGTQISEGSGLVLNPAGELIVEADPTHGSTLQIDSDSFRGTGVTLNRPINTRGRNLVVDSRGGLSINPGSTVNTQGGNITIESDGGSNSAIGIVVDEVIDSGGGDIDIEGVGGGPGLTINAAIDAGSGSLRLNGGTRGDGVGLILNPSGELVVAEDPTHSSAIEILSTTLSSSWIELNREINTRGRNLFIEGRRGVIANPGASIATQGGDIQIESSFTSAGSLGIVIDDAVDSAGGAIDIDGSGSDRGLTVNATIDAGSGDLRFNGDTGGDGPGLLLSDISEIVVEDDPTHSSTIEISSTSFSSGTGVTIDTVLDTRGRNLIIDGRRGVFVNTDSSVTTQGGSVTIQSSGGSGSNSGGIDVAGAIEANGGDITLDLSAANSAINVAGSISTRGAAVNLEARENIVGGGDIANAGGDISITSTQGSIFVNGEVNSSSSSGDAGDILIQTESTINVPNPTGNINTGLLLANSSASPGNGGNIQVEANGDSANITTGNITTRSGPTGDGGDITLITPNGTINTVGGTLLSLGATNGGDINLTAGSDIDTADIEILLVSGFTLDSGSINLVSASGNVDTSAGALIASAAEGNGGDISLEALLGDLILGDIDAQSINGNGGELTFTTGQDIFLATGGVATNNNDIEFNHRVNLVGNATVNSFGTGDVVFNTLVDGAHRLAVNAGAGEILLNEAIGSTIPLAEFAFQGELRALTPTGFDIAASQVTLLGDASINSASDSGITINSALNGAYNLTLDAGNDSLQINAPIGNLVPLNTLTVENDITTSNSQGVSIATVNEIVTQAITAPSGIQLISTNGNISTATLDASANGDAGDVTIATNGQAVVSTIDAQSETGVGGTVDITANSFLQVTDTFEDQNGVEASISVAGEAGGGSVLIRHGGEGDTPFTVGDSDVNGTAGTITRGNDSIQSIEPEAAFLNTYTQDGDRLQLISVPADIPELPSTGDGSNEDGANGSDGDANDNGSINGGGGLSGNGSGNGLGTGNPADLTAQDLLAALIGQLLDADTLATEDVDTETTYFQWLLPDGEELSIDVAIPPGLGTPAGIQADIVALLDEQLEEEFEDYFGRELSDRTVTAQSIRQTLTQIEAATETRSVMIYATSQIDHLNLVMIMPEGDSVVVSIPEARGAVLDQTIAQLTQAISAPLGSNYRQPAKQLYDWFITPLKRYLDELAIDNLVFVMDAGLRALPMAALYDGEQFLVEQYSLGLVPSFSLTDSRYQPLADSQVLSFGIENFEQWQDLNNLPFVEQELDRIEDLWPGQQFFNEGFTLAELQAQRQREKFDIIHLATHAVFNPQGPENSYIQLWDTRLQTDQLDALRWNAPPQVELLVLSACQTALGSLEAELGFAGLAVNAGVKSALASLWNVDDASTAVMMEAFYSTLRTTSTKAEALRQAQLVLLRGNWRLENAESRASLDLVPAFDPSEGEAAASRLAEADFSHPYYWAAFTMVGSPW